MTHLNPHEENIRLSRCSVGKNVLSKLSDLNSIPRTPIKKPDAVSNIWISAPLWWHEGAGKNHLETRASWPGILCEETRDILHQQYEKRELTIRSCVLTSTGAHCGICMCSSMHIHTNNNIKNFKSKPETMVRLMACVVSRNHMEIYDPCSCWP